MMPKHQYVVFDFHQTVDALIDQERIKINTVIGTTKRGIGPTYTNKVINHVIIIYSINNNVILPWNSL